MAIYSDRYTTISKSPDIPVYMEYAIAIAMGPGLGILVTTAHTIYTHTHTEQQMIILCYVVEYPQRSNSPGRTF